MNVKGAKQLASVSIASYSFNSLINACSGLSPTSSFPPGNSQSPAILFPLGLCAIRILPSESSNAQAETKTSGGLSVLTNINLTSVIGVDIDISVG